MELVVEKYEGDGFFGVTINLPYGYEGSKLLHGYLVLVAEYSDKHGSDVYCYHQDHLGKHAYQSWLQDLPEPWRTQARRAEREARQLLAETDFWSDSIESDQKLAEENRFERLLDSADTARGSELLADYR